MGVLDADPTGSSAEDSSCLTEAPIDSVGAPRTYPEAVAGRPTSMNFDPTSGAFELAYVANHALDAPTVIFVSFQIHYPAVARVIRDRDGESLLVKNNSSTAAVCVTVAAGSCSSQ